MATTEVSERALRDFWARLATGVAVAVAGSNPDELLGVRDGFQSYFNAGINRPVSIAVVPQVVEEPGAGLELSDEATVALARDKARALRQRLGDEYHFYAAVHGGIQEQELDGRHHYFLRAWTVLLGPVGEALGSSGSLELPERLIAGLTSEEIPFAVPGTRRRGGMISSLTGGLETRRRAVSTGTLHALASLFYGVLEQHPRRRW